VTQDTASRRAIAADPCAAPGWRSPPARRVAHASWLPFVQMLASAVHVFRNGQMHWTIRATCPECLSETIAPLLMGIPVHCDICSALIKIDPKRTVFHESEDEPSSAVKS
jgi:hypothetical protein